MNILPAENAYMFDNLPEFLRHAEILQPGLESQGSDEVFYTFWRDEQREAAQCELPREVPASRNKGALSAADSENFLLQRPCRSI
jgi:hypothetical protein